MVNGRAPGRPRKVEGDAKQTPAPKGPPPKQGPATEDFIRTRDSVVTGLATLQSALQELSRAYIAHTNTIIAGGASNPQELLALSNPFGQNGSNLPRMLSAADYKHENDEGVVRPKKQKRVHDPNAPKRPLTPYFLYMQTARSVIANDLGPSATPGEVSTEGTRRWGALPAAQKEGWKAAYEQNLQRYRERKAAYLAGEPVDNGPAAQLAAENGAAQVTDDDDDDDDDDDASVAIPNVAHEGAHQIPTPASNKRRKSAGEVINGKSPAVASAPRQPARETEVLPPSMSRVSSSHGPSKSPERKRKKRERKPKISEAAEDEEPAPEKERRSKRKRKSDVGEGA
ncbi:MAG: hypothetical protein M1823_002336 [Watsoniomyces obsoletus]|nr:MAG: hypothetical protein M1823_002336 [Watsoniomyces obsoletus]